MTDQNDPIESALESYKGRRWPGDYNDPKLKESIMQNSHSRRSSSSMGRRGALVATLAFTLLATAGFAATGGVEMVKGWFITVEIDGQPVDLNDADIDIQTDGDTVTVSIGEMEIEGVEPGSEAVITVISSGPDQVGQTVVVKEASSGDKTGGETDDD